MKNRERPTVLVVEDEFIIALDLSETVRDLGFRVEGPFADKENAFIAIDQHMPDCAILDVKTADGEVYPLADAIALVKSISKAKFDETIEMSMNLGIDPRHADQMVRGLTSLPNGTGKTVRVGVFAR